MPQTESSRTGWASAIRQRHRMLPQRLVVGPACALLFSTILGLPICLTWLTVYILLQGAEFLAFRPVIRNKGFAPQGWRRGLGDLALFANTSAYAFIAVPLWLIGGVPGGVVATMLLATGAINSVIASSGNLRVFIWTVVPQVSVLALTPLFLARWGVEGRFLLPVAIGVVAFIFFCLTTRSRLHAAGVAEARALKEAEDKRRQAEAVMEGRSALLAAVAHDLRTPISAILTGVHTLHTVARSSTARQQVAMIEDAGVMMKDLLDDLLDHARLDAGRMTVEVQDFDLRDLLNHTLRLWQGPVGAKGLRLRIDGSRYMPAMVRGDAMRLRQVLNNLISNAVKFTDEGSITVRLCSWRDEASDHVLLVDVADTGPGMTTVQMERLFTPFDQTADGIAARYGGSGLGLAISRDLVELMGGRLTVRSDPGRGSTFTLALVLAQSDAERAPPSAAQTPKPTPLPEQAPSPLPDPRPALLQVPAATPAAPAPAPHDAEEVEALRVLVVDDHDINRRAIQVILQAVDCRLTMAEDGLAALKACEGDVFDVIFMDVRMPELDGRETTRRLRAGGGPNAATPVIAVTADTSPEDIQACLDAGMNHFVAKPLTPTVLLNTLGQALDQAPAETSAPSARSVA
ncbi:ATP-binding protein [Brevundimonas diminuta]|uniref:ATP-binding protein n=1 Tax=Brevundimonas diminuta TaxID=293 RepID=UPI00320B3E1C